uniref:Uncharacterized protein n=1 Tax=Anguilla anguilla TaxID=7936 RepID=A0A0E9RBZ5_ANGAN
MSQHPLNQLIDCSLQYLWYYLRFISQTLDSQNQREDHKRESAPTKLA